MQLLFIHDLGNVPVLTDFLKSLDNLYFKHFLWLNKFDLRNILYPSFKQKKIKFQKIHCLHVKDTLHS